MIPFLDLQAAYHELRPEIDIFACALDSSRYLSPKAEPFEAAFVGYCGAVRCMGLVTALMHRSRHFARWTFPPR